MKIIDDIKTHNMKYKIQGLMIGRLLSHSDKVVEFSEIGINVIPREFIFDTMFDGLT